MMGNSTNSGSELVLYRYIWVFPIAFAIHILEEVWEFPNWVNHILGGQSSTIGFLISNCVFMIILIGLCALAFKSRNWVAIALLFLWVSIQQFGNFVFHLYTQLAFNTYSPGVISAVLLYYPIYLYVGFVAVRDKHLSMRFFVACTLLGPILMGLFAWANIYHFGLVPWKLWLMQS